MACLIFTPPASRRSAWWDTQENQKLQVDPGMEEGLMNLNAVYHDCSGVYTPSTEAAAEAGRQIKGVSSGCVL